MCLEGVEAFDLKIEGNGFAISKLDQKLDNQFEAMTRYIESSEQQMKEIKVTLEGNKIALEENTAVMKRLESMLEKSERGL